jgi:hypothetical protein
VAEFLCKGGRCPGLSWPAPLLEHPRTCLDDPATWPGLAAQARNPNRLGSVTRDVESVRLALASAPCIACGAPSVCWGNADDCGGSGTVPMCDDCCGHGGEDGWCTMAKDEDLSGLAVEMVAAGWHPGMSFEDASTMLAAHFADAREAP